MSAHKKSSTTASETAYSERLSAPVRWWLVALAFVSSLFLAAGFSLGPVPGVLVGVGALAIVTVVLKSFGASRITVDAEALTVGINRIEWPWVGTARALDAEGTRRRLGPQADARAHLVTRPYLPESVEVALTDPADGHPYWLIGSRNATALAASINARSGGSNR